VGRLRFIIGWAGTEERAGPGGSRPLSEGELLAARGWPESLGGVVAVAVAAVAVAFIVAVVGLLLMALQPLKIASARVSFCGGIGAQTTASDASFTVWAARPKPLWTSEDTG